jgi:hypothetical protein
LYSKRPYLNPFTPYNLVNGQSFLWICFQASLDEVLTVRGDVGPLRFRELILARSDSFLHAGGDGLAMVGVEWGKTTNSEI